MQLERLARLHPIGLRRGSLHSALRSERFFSLDWLAKAKFGAIPILQLERLARLHPIGLRRGSLHSAL
ncbi:MAG: hypothetical protein V3U56_01660, partial [Syntrophobacteria bacterium]